MISAADGAKPVLRLALGSTAYNSISRALAQRLDAIEAQRGVTNARVRTTCQSQRGKAHSVLSSASKVRFNRLSTASAATATIGSASADFDKPFARRRWLESALLQPFSYSTVLMLGPLNC